MQQIEQERYCLYKEHEGDFKVMLGADDFIVLGADFKLIDPATKVIVEEWKMSTENGQVVNYSIKTPTEELHKKTMVWKVLCCSSNPNKYQGKALIKLLQNNIAKKLTLPSNYILKNVPPCQLLSTEDFSGSLTFIKQ